MDVKVPTKAVSAKVDAEEADRLWHVKLTFSTLIICQTFINFDSGVIPAVLSVIEREYNVTPVILGLLGALPYIGLVIVAPLTGLLLQLPGKQKVVVVSSLMGNVVATALLASAIPPHISLILIARILQGFTQATFVIFAPVWVDEFAPSKHVTLWMGLIQGFIVVGVMIGYLFAGLCPMMKISWRWAAALQAAMIFCGAVAQSFCRSDCYNLRHTRLQTEEALPTIPILASPTAVSDAPLPITSASYNGERPIGDSSLVSAQHQYRSASLGTPVADAQRGQTLSLLASAGMTRVRLPSGQMAETETLLMDESRQRQREASLETAMTSQRSGRLQYARSRSFRQVMPNAPAGVVLEHIDGTMQSVQGDYVLQRGHSKTQESLLSLPQAIPEDLPLPDASSVPKGAGYLRQIFGLFRNPLYVCIVATVCVLFYVVTGIQYWSTKYMQNVLNVTGTKLVVTFAGVAATAPTMGVLFGGFFIDWLGGYRSNAGLQRSLGICFAFATCCGVCGTINSLFKIFTVVLVSDWLLLFFGGAMLPPLTGMCLASVGDPRLRATCSGVSTLLYNTLGFTLGSFLPGVFIRPLGLHAAMVSIYMWSWLGAITIGIAILYVRCEDIGPVTLEVAMRAPSRLSRSDVASESRVLNVLDSRESLSHVLAAS